MSGQGRDKGGGKTRGGGGSIKITKTKERKTKDLDEKIIHLRKAVFAEDGKDKDITIGIAPAFLKFDRNGLNVEIAFSARLTEDEEDWAFDIIKSNMEEVYDASGYGWDDEDKIKELTEEGTRFLLVREKKLNFDDTPGRLVALAHFRFTIQGEVMDAMVGETSLHVWDIHVEDAYQRKGLGKHLLTLMELIARREKMRMISIPIQLNDTRSEAWIKKMGKGFIPDKSLLQLVGFDAEMEGFEVYAKSLNPPVPKVPEKEKEEGTAIPIILTNKDEKTPLKSATLSVEQLLSPCSVADVLESGSKIPQTVATNIVSNTPSHNVTTVLSNPSDDDWELVSGPGSAEEGQEETKEEAVGHEDMPSAVERDLIDQIRCMFVRDSGRQASAVEEREWLKSIRDVTEPDDETEEEE